MNKMSMRNYVVRISRVLHRQRYRRYHQQHLGAWFYDTVIPRSVRLNRVVSLQRHFTDYRRMDHPWGTAIDGEDKVWVANFGPLQLGNNFRGRLTKLWGSIRLRDTM